MKELREQVQQLKEQYEKRIEVAGDNACSRRKARRRKPKAQP